MRTNDTEAPIYQHVPNFLLTKKAAPRNVYRAIFAVAFGEKKHATLLPHDTPVGHSFSEQSATRPHPASHSQTFSSPHSPCPLHMLGQTAWIVPTLQHNTTARAAMMVDAHERPNPRLDFPFADTAGDVAVGSRPRFISGVR